ncbi:hypothetical protein AMATHDRAFT_4665 [Amanita thiersii Skay4041]|uniref:DUF6533 domain-containing protein n=1 Tax=Amanita thiersii Skay4041 TaxID=703135 RepID=A0A2A9NPX1_9AGAR|nr:hypothetical protein AMATHDRAFT_4665 [Amanita thiersii Skay4041]
MDSSLIEAFRNSRIVANADLAAIALQVYDYFLTLQLEVRWMWNTIWTPVKVSYFLMRYLPFVTMTMISVVDSPRLTPEECLRFNNAYAYMVTIDIAFSEVILTLRTWASWRRDGRIGIALILFVLCIWVPALVNLQYVVDSLACEFYASP